MHILNALFIILLIKPSYQWCRSTVGFTTCGDEKLSKNKPLRITEYKHLLEFEGSIEDIPEGSFRLLPELTTLYITENHVKKVERGAFDGLPNLNKLSLFGNELTIIKEGVFRNCENLKALNLGHNNIAEVENNAFSDLTTLQELELSFNNLREVPTAVNKIKSLTHLKLNHNKLSSLVPNVFNNLNNLEILDLSDNRMNAIASAAFSGLSGLKELNLKFNYLRNLSVRNLLSDLSSLSVVKLSANSFTCKDLVSIVDAFQNRGVEVARGVSNAQNTVRGMACVKE